MTVEMRGGEGMLTVGADFAGVGPRFDISLAPDGSGETVGMITQIVPIRSGLEVRQSPPRVYHTYELIYDPGKKSADLWIDGQLKLAGYHGHFQYQEDRGLNFGAGIYKSGRASGSFRFVRFEINP